MVFILKVSIKSMGELDISFKEDSKLNLYKFKTFLRAEIKALFSSGKPMVIRR
jgi:hypothetical protein